MGKRKLKKKKKKLLARRRRAGMDIRSAADRDRISQLPDVILHHILSLLEPEDAFSAACLSKSWFNVWLTCPDLTFSFYPDVDLPVPGKNSSKFEKLVEDTIARFSKSEFSVRSLRIKVHESDNKKWNPSSLPPKLLHFSVAKSIEFAVEKHVEILRVHGIAMSICRLPDTICQTIFTAKSLIELELRHCYFYSIDGNDTMFLLATKYGPFNNLKRLIFQDVYLGGYWEIEKLFCNSPSIEEIELCDYRPEFEKLRVSNVPKLKRFKMHIRDGCFGATVEIVAPSLESFDYFGQCTLNIDACQNLKRLRLSRIEFMTLKRFNSFSNFLFLEFLEINYVHGSMASNYNISSQSLKHVRFCQVDKVDTEVMIDAPNLLLLEYGASGCNSISFRNTPKQLKVTLSGPYLDWAEPRIWFLLVRSSLMKLAIQTEIYLSLHDRKKCFVSIKDSEDLPEPEVEDLVLYCCDQRKEFEFESLFNAARGDAHRNLIEAMKAIGEYYGTCFKLKWSA